jgi:hypothetical protein
MNAQRLGDVAFHRRGVGHQLGLLRYDGGVHVYNFAVAEYNLPGGFLQKEFAGRAAPARVGIGEKVPDVAFPQRAQDGVADGVHERVGIGMPVQALAVGDFHPAQDQLASLRQRMHIVTNSSMNHKRRI